VDYSDAPASFSLPGCCDSHGDDDNDDEAAAALDDGDSEWRALSSSSGSVASRNNNKKKALGRRCKAAAVASNSLPSCGGDAQDATAASTEQGRKGRAATRKKRCFTVSKGNGNLSRTKYKPHVKKMLDEAMMDKLVHKEDWLRKNAPRGQKYTPKQADLMRRTALTALQIRHYMHNNARKAKRLFAIMQTNAPSMPATGVGSASNSKKGRVKRAV
jgi:hypothetical protein